MIRMFIDRRTNKDHPEWLAVSDLRVTTVNKNKDLFKEMDSILRVKKKNDERHDPKTLDNYCDISALRGTLTFN